MNTPKRIHQIIISLFLIVSVNITMGQNQQNDAVFWGLFEENIQNNLSQVDAYGAQFDKNASMVLWYIGWRADNDHSFPLSSCKNVYDAGYIPHIVWEPWIGIDDFLSGNLDADLEKFGQDIAEFGNPVMLRWGHEFNGDWYPWSYNNNELVPASKWIEAYKYVHDKIIEAGGTNAIWLWSPNCGNGGKNPQDFTLYYPGDEYVDWIAIDGYNWGTSQTWSSWQLFAGVFGPTYNKIVTKYPKKPIMISEFGCTGTGGNKAAWITDMFNQLKNNYKKIKAIVWFNVNKETDWRFNETVESTNAFKAGLADSMVSSDLDKLLNMPTIVLGKNEIRSMPEEITIFPNPACDFLNIESSLKGDDEKIVIYNTSGLKVMEIDTKEGITDQQVNLKSLKKGMYFVSYKNTTKKFIKE